MSRLLTELNERQTEAVCTTEGPLLVIAGAGSGKTRVLTRRLAYILDQRLAEPRQVLAVTFTNKAAKEMQDRVTQLMGSSLDWMNVSTFHSFCVRVLRREAELIGYGQNFTIFDQTDSLSLIKNCIKELGYSDKQFPPKGQLRKISDAKSQLISAEQFTSAASGYFETRTAELYSRYQKRLRACQAMDFDDLLFNTVVLLRTQSEVRNKYRSWFRYLMVDEYQDTNRIQYYLLRELLGDHHNLCVVGDEDQSIYGWRGADITNILNFEKDYPGAKIIKLEQNYRSTQVILNAASAVIKNNEMRKDKTLWTSDQGGEPIELLLVDTAEDEASSITDRVINDSTRVTYKDSVILYRTNAQSRPFEEQFRRHNIPYQIVGGVAFYQRKEIKDLLGYLKLICNPADDISFERVINYPKRGLGQKTVSTIQQYAATNAIPCLAVLENITLYPDLAARQSKFQPFLDIILEYRTKRESLSVDLLVQDLVSDLRLIEDLLAEDAVTGQTRVENIEVFIEGSAEYARSHPEAHLDDYLAEISLFTDLDAYSEIDDKITLMTIHAAKGLEFDRVYLVGMEEGLFPLQRTTSEPQELEEERRLFYVGATRARKKLFLSSAGSRFRFGEVASIPSRFIKEIPGELMETVNLQKNRYNFSPAHAAPFKSHAADPARQTEKLGVHYEYEEEEVLQVGRIVSHPTFGRGRILSCQGYGDSLRLEIMFTGLGVKKIMAKYARLKIVG